jgi:WD40 repeat protein
VETSALLALESMQKTPLFENGQALRASLALLRKPLSIIKQDKSATLVAFSPNGRYLAAGGQDNTAHIFDTRNGKEIARSLHKGPILSLAFSLDSQYLASGSNDNTVRIWQVASNKELQSWKLEGAVAAVAFSPDGRSVATGSFDRSVRIFDLSSGRELAHWTQEGQIVAISFSPDGQKLATGSSDDTARIYDISKRQQISTFVHQDAISAIAFSPDGNKIATASYDHTARVFDLSNNKELRLDHQGAVLALAFSPDGQQVATGGDDGNLRVFQVSDGMEFRHLAHQGAVDSVAFSPDGEWVAAASHDHTARILELGSNREVARLAHQDIVRSVSFSPDGRQLATASDDHTVRIFDAAHKQIRWQQKPREVRHISLVHNGRWTATLSNEGIVQVVQTEDAREVLRVGQDSAVIAMAVAAEADVMATANKKQIIQAFDISTGKALISPIIQDSITSALALSPDGRFLATANEYRGPDMTSPSFSTHIFALRNGKNRKEAVVPLNNDSRVLSVVLSSDGSIIATGTSNMACVFDVATGRELLRLEYEFQVQILAFSPDGEQLATGSGNEVRVYNIHKGKELWHFRQEGEVKNLTFKPDGLWLAIGSDNKTIHLFETKSGRELAGLVADVGDKAIAFSDGNRVLQSLTVGPYSVLLQQHLLLPDDLIRQACSNLTRNLTSDEWKLYMKDGWTRYLGFESYHKTCPNLPDN